MDVKAYYKANTKGSVEKQKKIIKAQSLEALEQNLAMQLRRIEQQLYCKVCTRSGVKRMIVLINEELKIRREGKVISPKLPPNILNNTL